MAVVTEERIEPMEQSCSLVVVAAVVLTEVRIGLVVMKLLCPQVAAAVAEEKPGC